MLDQALVMGSRRDLTQDPVGRLPNLKKIVFILFHGTFLLLYIRWNARVMKIRFYENLKFGAAVDLKINAMNGSNYQFHITNKSKEG